MKEKINTSKKNSNYKHNAIKNHLTYMLNKAYEQELMQGLYISASPIGNLTDITIRSINVLNQADLIACEDTRVTKKLLNCYNIKTPTITYNDNSNNEVRSKIIKKLKDGKNIVLVSDAGTPLISDPGYKLIARAIDEGIQVISLPGPSSSISALVASGLPTHRNMFIGFLPASRRKRQNELNKISEIDTTLIFYESSNRLLDTLEDMNLILGPRKSAIIREMTKLHEEIIRGTLIQLKETLSSRKSIKGEITIIISPAEKQKEIISEEIDLVLRNIIKEIPIKNATRILSNITGISQRNLYKRCIKIKEG